MNMINGLLRELASRVTASKMKAAYHTDPPLKLFQVKEGTALTAGLHKKSTVMLGRYTVFIECYYAARSSSQNKECNHAYLLIS